MINEEEVDRLRVDRLRSVEDALLVYSYMQNSAYYTHLRHRYKHLLSFDEVEKKIVQHRLVS